MNSDTTLLIKTWEESQLKSNSNTRISKIKFNELTNSIISMGIFYFYIIAFFDMSISHVSPAIADIHGFNPESVTFNDILATIHPEDIPFVSKCENEIMGLFYNKLGPEKLTSYKVNYSFRSMMKNGNYELLNHQAIMLTLDENGGFSKSLNIHTCIDHLSFKNTFKFSLIGLNGQPSYMNMIVNDDNSLLKLSKREIEIINLIANGDTNTSIANALHLSPETIKKHRKNILAKTKCINTSHLIKCCMELGFI